METLQSTIFIEFDVNTKQITFLRGDNIVDYDSNATSVYVRVKYKNLSGNTIYLTPSELEDYKFSLYTIKPATSNVNVITGEITDELKENVYGGIVKFEIPRACTNRLGIVKCEIHINQGNKIIASSTFVLNVQQSLVTAFDDELLGDEDFPVLRQLILEIQRANNIDDNNRRKITTYSSDKIETIKEDLCLQIKNKANKEDIGAPSQEQVNTWLDDHPEATTTIQDNSITGNKMNIESMYYPSEYSTSENFVTGKYIGMSGAIETEVSMAYFKVDVMPNTQYEIKSLPTGIFFAEFNDDNSIKVYHEWDGSNNTTGMHIITTSSTTNNIRINLGKDDMGSSNFYCKRYGERKIELKWLNMSKWFNKKAVIIGDSIVAGADGASLGASSVPKESNLPNQLKDRLGLNEIINYGASGTTIAQTSGNDNGMGGLAFVNRFSNMDDDADLVIVFGGTNDYGSSYTVDFGTPSDTEKTTFYGALNYLCNGLIEKYNGKTIVFMTPLHRDIETANVKGKTLLDYVNAIKEVCQTFGIPVIDTYNISGFTPKNNSFKQAYLPDGLHPNEIGYKLLAERIYKNFELF